MPLFALKSLSKSVTLENAAEDRRAARRVGQYRVGALAIYFPGFPGDNYVPYAAVTRAFTRNTTLPLTGCCGKALPMVRLRICFDEDAHQDFLFEKLEQADAALNAVIAARPDIPTARETQTARAF